MISFSTSTFLFYREILRRHYFRLACHYFERTTAETDELGEFLLRELDAASRPTRSFDDRLMAVDCLELLDSHFLEGNIWNFFSFWFFTHFLFSFRKYFNRHPHFDPTIGRFGRRRTRGSDIIILTKIQQLDRLHSIKLGHVSLRRKSFIQRLGRRKTTRLPIFIGNSGWVRSGNKIFICQRYFFYIKFFSFLFRLRKTIRPTTAFLTRTKPITIWNRSWSRNGCGCCALGRTIMKFFQRGRYPKLKSLNWSSRA